MSSQFLFSSFDPSIRLVSSAAVLLYFFALDVLLKPFQSTSTVKENWSLVLIVSLVCQGMIFENDDPSASSLFVGFVILLITLCTLTPRFSYLKSL
jgi:hypothetical protein